ncbi:hypothetical protein NMG60_11018110 [Bertholletia excelsa]
MSQNTAQFQPSQIAPTEGKLSDVDIRDSAYFKILAHVQQLRPFFIEVLRTPDFHNCNASYEIQKRMKLSHENSSSCWPLSDVEKPEIEQADRLCHLQPKQPLKKSSKEELPHRPVSLAKVFSDDRLKGSHVVGGSVSGWNFITFINRKPAIYSGVTKESYRNRHGKP